MKSTLRNTRLLAMWPALGILGLALFCAIGAHAQQSLTPPKVEFKLATGISSFGGDSGEKYRHTIVGGSMRFYLTRHISIEPELLVMRRGSFDRDLLITPHVALDLTNPSGRVVPYLIVGMGVEYHRDQITYLDFFNNNQLVTRRISGRTISANAGGGVKLFLTKGLFVAPDVRVGHEPSFRATISAGYVFAGRKGG